MFMMTTYCLISRKDWSTFVWELTWVRHMFTAGMSAYKVRSAADKFHFVDDLLP